MLLGSVILMLFVNSALAKPYTLKCTTVEGYPPADLVIDLDKRVMEWGVGGVQRYTVTNVTEEYITGLESADYVLRPATDPPVGGKIMVLNRFNGDYKRAWVGLFCKDPPPNCEGGDTVLRAFTQSGKCFRPMF
jgi:hypothetical protein